MDTDHTTVTRIEPCRGLVPLNLHELWDYRELAVFLLVREIKGRYRQMALGPLWLVLGPVVNTVLFTFLFGYVARVETDGLPYPLFSYSALVTWGFFASCMQSAAGSLLDSRDLIAKVYFPRLLIPLVGVMSSIVNLAPSVLILAGMMMWFGYPPLMSLFVLPVYMVLAGVTGLAVGLWWAPWIVHFRDMRNVLDYVAKGWMYLSPVVYAATLVPERWRGIYRLNPMTQIIEGFRWSLLGTPRPSWVLLGASSAVLLLLLAAGAYHFRRAERSIVDIA
jgi:lipopolysaccharide transport system permease protein